MKKILSLILSASLLTACVIQKPGLPAESSYTQQAYDKYDENALLTQKTFDELTDKIFLESVTDTGINLHYTIANPEAFGITEFPATFGSFTLDQMHQNMQEIADLKKTIDTIDSSLLDDEQQLTYDILKSYVDTELLSEGLELYTEPLTTTIGIQAQLPILLAEYAFYTRQDIDNYLLLLSNIDTYYAQIIDFEREKSKAGLFMSDAAADNVIESCSGYLVAPDKGILTETFISRLDEITSLTDEERQRYIEENQRILKEHFIPAYQLIVDGLSELKGTGTNENGLSQFPDGKKYYNYLVNSCTGTSYKSIKSLREAIEEQLNSDLAESSRILKENPELYNMLSDYSFKHTKPDDILEDLRSQISKDFPELPECSHTIKYVPKVLENVLSPAFYLTPPIDRYTENVIYINNGLNSADSDIYTTLAHEGYPGHLYQSVYFFAQNPCHLRQMLSFGSYSEGWATYVEYYSYLLDNGLEPGLGELLMHTSASNMALYALLDIYIHYYGWDRTQVQKYLSTYYDISESEIIDSVFNPIVENPANYLQYYTGYLEIINMKEAAMQSQKESFDLKAFNTFILDIGPAPFSVIQEKFKEWLFSVK